MATNMLTYNLSEPLNGATTAKVEIHAGDGNLTIDGLAGGDQALACGTLQYLEKQGLPTRTLAWSNGQAALTLRSASAGQPWFRLPWAACNGATEWRIDLNTTASSDITAHANGGNIKLNLSGMTVTSVSADTGGGNVDVVLPDKVANLFVIVKTGAGNIVVHVPNGIAARIQATAGLGKAVVDPRFSRTDKNTYQSPDCDGAANKVEITASSGAGNVIVTTN
jgi:hypothetical protein